MNSSARDKVSFRSGSGEARGGQTGVEDIEDLGLLAIGKEVGVE